MQKKNEKTDGKSVRGGLPPNDKSHEKQDPVSTMQNTGWTNYSYFLAWSGPEKVLITIGHCPMGSQQPFFCVLCDFRHGHTQMNKQPGILGNFQHGNTQMNKQTTGDQLKKTDVKKM